MSNVIEKTKEELEKEISDLIPKKELAEYKKFAFKGQMVQMAVAFILGAAFNKVVMGISENIIMPLINYGLSQTGSNWRAISWTPIVGMTFELGKFCGVFVDFLVTSGILYILYIKIIERLAPTIICIETIPCPYCKSQINWESQRCPQCTTWLENEWI